MRVVSNNSPEDLAKRRARERAEQAIVELAANLMRIVRGAGKPYELKSQLRDTLAAMQDHWDASKTWPYEEMTQALRGPPLPDWYDQVSVEERARYYAERRVVAGALQIVASDLLGQRTQERAGQSEMHAGLRELERLLEEENRRWREQTSTPAKRRAVAAAALAKAKAKAKVPKKPKR